MAGINVGSINNRNIFGLTHLWQRTECIHSNQKATRWTWLKTKNRWSNYLSCLLKCQANVHIESDLGIQKCNIQLLQGCCKHMYSAVYGKRQPITLYYKSPQCYLTTIYVNVRHSLSDVVWGTLCTLYIMSLVHLHSLQNTTNYTRELSGHCLGDHLPSSHYSPASYCLHCNLGIVTSYRVLCFT